MSISSASDTFSSMKPPASPPVDRAGPICGVVAGAAGGAAGAGGLGGGAGGAFCCAEATQVPHHAVSAAAAKTLLDLTAYSFSAVRLAVLFFCRRSQTFCSVSFNSVFLRTHVRFPKGVACSKRMESPSSTAVVPPAPASGFSPAFCWVSPDSPGPPAPARPPRPPGGGGGGAPQPFPFFSRPTVESGRGFDGAFRNGRHRRRFLGLLGRRGWRGLGGILGRQTTRKDTHAY